MAELQLAQRFEQVRQASEGKIPVSEHLYKNVLKIIAEIQRRYQQQGKMTVIDAEELYGWKYTTNGEYHYGMVPELLSEDDFKTMALLCFRDPTWLARLLDPSQGAEHIHELNRKIGERIDTMLTETNRQEADILDLGAGTLGTLTAVVNAALHDGRSFSFTTTDLTQELVDEAKKRANALEDKHSGHLRIQVFCTDMVVFLQQQCEANSFEAVTASFSLHHLHPKEQMSIIQRVFTCLKSGGIFVLADPQEGKSAFNLEYLVIQEPEGVFASFAPPEDMLKIMGDAGFTNLETLSRDDKTYEGYAICGLKP
jgi:2-polyprenyl-3-methyl-5-hydroxy-6-metoxy-1,4-benzoquinol methylase